jgi:hypothetical protein
MAPPELEPVSLDPVEPEAVEPAVAMTVPDVSEPVSLEGALDAAAPVPSLDGSCDVCDGCDAFAAPCEPPPVSPASVIIPCLSGHMAPVCSDDDPAVLQAIPSTTSGIADAIFDMDMEVLLAGRSCVLRGRGATPAAEVRPGERAPSPLHSPLMSRARPVLVALAAVLATAGCRRPAGPAETYRAFAAAARAGDADGVWSRLSARSREVLEARAREIAARAPAGVIPASGKELVLGDLAAQAPRLRATTVVRESADAAVLSVEVEGASRAREVALVREGGVWRVVLPFDN